MATQPLRTVVIFILILGAIWYAGPVVGFYEYVLFLSWAIIFGLFLIYRDMRLLFVGFGIWSIFGAVLQATTTYRSFQSWYVPLPLGLLFLLAGSWVWWKGEVGADSLFLGVGLMVDDENPRLNRF